MLDRGIAQIYMDGIPQGFLYRYALYRADDARVGGGIMGLPVSGIRKKVLLVFTLLSNWKRTNVRKNNGYYSGPKSCFLRE